MKRPRQITLVAMLAGLLTLAAVAVAQQPTPPVPLPSTPVCAGSPVSVLVVNERGRVSLADPAPLNLRVQPGTASERIGEIPAGGVFYVLDGPRCSERYTWYRVEARIDGDLQEGWVAEGDDNGYFVETFPAGR
jgi:hypothetical protein